MTIALSYLFAALGGILTWSLVEYLLHRFLGHQLKTNLRFKKEHLKHHFLENYFAPTKIKALIAALVIALTWMITAPLIGSKLAGIFSLSFTGFYLFYEFLHRSLHVEETKTAWGKYLREHHLSHHEKGVEANYGVTTPLWDLLFRTYQSQGLTRRASRHKHPHGDHDQTDGHFDEERRSLTRPDKKQA